MPLLKHCLRQAYSTPLCAVRPERPRVRSVSLSSAHQGHGAVRFVATKLRSWFALCCCLPALALSVLADGGPVKEYQVKAAFVYNFLKFVEWPVERFAETTSPLIIGVAGKGPMLRELEAAVKGRKVNGHELIVRTLSGPESALCVHALFVDGGEDGRVAEWLRTPPGVLTIGESDAFGKHGGMINFALQGDKVRFEINIDSAEQAKLKISAQLQKLARLVLRTS